MHTYEGMHSTSFSKVLGLGMQLICRLSSGIIGIPLQSEHNWEGNIEHIGN